MTRLFIMLALVLLSAACTLEFDPSEFLPTQPTHTAAPTATTTPRPPTLTPIVPTTAPCVPRYDWYSYVVVRGDTLASIAQRSGSTVAELAAGNCLRDVNTIYVGQVIVTPRVVVTPQPNPQIVSFVHSAGMLSWSTTGAAYVRLSHDRPTRDGSVVIIADYSPTASIPVPPLTPEYAPGVNFYLTLIDAAGIVIRGANGQPISQAVYVPVNPGIVPPPACPPGSMGIYSVAISPVIGVRDGCQQLVAGGMVTVSVLVLPPDAQSVEFFVTASNAGLMSIGTDADLVDGASVVWTAPARTFTGTVFAYIYTASGTQETASTPIYAVQ